eukprot:10170654-Alexandrium_andersonii.AAC.1
MQTLSSHVLCELSAQFMKVLTVNRSSASMRVLMSMDAWSLKRRKQTFPHNTVVHPKTSAQSTSGVLFPTSVHYVTRP